MKRFFIYALMLFALAACTQGQMPNGEGVVDDVVINLPTPEYGYILFNSEVGTRGQLYENGVSNEADEDDNRFYQNFGVIGYTYMAEDWTIAEVQATPMDAFYQKEIVWNGETGSACSYTYDGGNYQEWIGKQKYAFFAYSPYNLSDYGTIATSSKTHEGNPYIDYTLPSRSSVDNHVDIMTAYAIDTNYSTRSVDFNMEHRLTALDVAANNLYNEGTSLEVTYLKVNLTNLLYDKVRIPLNGRDEPNLNYYNGMASNKAAGYELIKAGTAVSKVAVTRGKEAALTNPYSKTMIFIPQDQHIDTNGDGTLEDFTMKGSVEVKYKLNGGAEITQDPVSFSMNRDLKAGRRYYIQLNFASGDINILIIESDEWADGAKVDHDFE